MLLLKHWDLMTCLIRTANFSYLVSPLEAINARGVKDRTEVSWWTDDFNLDAAGVVVQAKDVAIVFVNSDSGEGPSAYLSSLVTRVLLKFIVAQTSSTTTETRVTART